ncbi:MAG: HNH endonuclease [Bdellovibrionia bacterium]
MACSQSDQNFNPPQDLSEDYYLLDEQDTDPRRLKKEREKARQLKKTQWWQNQVNRGICSYCEQRFRPDQLTLDHVVPLARGGESRPGNVVPACVACNRQKKLDTPVEQLFKKLAQEPHPFSEE